MTDSHHLTGPEHQLERMIFFSDAVFAIAITLLIIEIRPPHLRIADPTSAHIDALAELAPELLGFFISFFVIGAFWAGHHRAFAMARHWNEGLFSANLRMLFAIVAMPFFTGYLSANPGARVPVVLYCGWMLVAALFNVRLQRRVTSSPVVDPDVAAERIGLVRARGLSVALGALTALVAAAILPFPAMALIGLASIPLWRKLLTARRGVAAPPT